MFAAMFPAPPMPAFADDHRATTPGYLRYEDVDQLGRLLPIAIPPALTGLWRGAVTRHPGARSAHAAGVVPLLTRMTMVATDQHVRVDRPIETRAGFELAHDRDATGAVSKLFFNAWCEVHATSGRIFPREPAGPLALAGTLFAEHTFTRPFAAADQRRVTRLDAPGYPAVPDAHYPAPAPATAMDAPAGATWLDELADDPEPVHLTLDHTDSNQHVNSLAYVRIFLPAVFRRLAVHGRSLRVRSRAIDIAYRKPCFAGDRVRSHVRLFALDDRVGGAGMISGDDGKPRCYVRVELMP
jgi:hypothetical protein